MEKNIRLEGQFPEEYVSITNTMIDGVISSPIAPSEKRVKFHNATVEGFIQDFEPSTIGGRLSNKIMAKNLFKVSCLNSNREFVMLQFFDFPEEFLGEPLLKINKCKNIKSVKKNLEHLVNIVFECWQDGDETVYEVLLVSKGGRSSYFDDEKLKPFGPCVLKRDNSSRKYDPLFLGFESMGDGGVDIVYLPITQYLSNQIIKRFTLDTCVGVLTKKAYKLEGVRRHKDIKNTILNHLDESTFTWSDSEELDAELLNLCKEGLFLAMRELDFYNPKEVSDGSYFRTDSSYFAAYTSYPFYINIKRITETEELVVLNLKPLDFNIKGFEGSLENVPYKSHYLEDFLEDLQTVVFKVKDNVGKVLWYSKKGNDIIFQDESIFPTVYLKDIDINPDVPFILNYTGNKDKYIFSDYLPLYSPEISVITESEHIQVSKGIPSKYSDTFDNVSEEVERCMELLDNEITNPTLDKELDRKVIVSSYESFKRMYKSFSREPGYISVESSCKFEFSRELYNLILEVLKNSSEKFHPSLLDTTQTIDFSLDSDESISLKNYGLKKLSVFRADLDKEIFLSGKDFLYGISFEVVIDGNIEKHVIYLHENYRVDPYYLGSLVRRFRIVCWDKVFGEKGNVSTFIDFDSKFSHLACAIEAGQLKRNLLLDNRYCLPLASLDM